MDDIREALGNRLCPGLDVTYTGNNSRVVNRTNLTDLTHGQPAGTPQTALRHFRDTRTKNTLYLDTSNCQAEMSQPSGTSGIPLVFKSRKPSTIGGCVLHPLESTPLCRPLNRFHWLSNSSTWRKDASQSSMNFPTESSVSPGRHNIMPCWRLGVTIMAVYVQASHKLIRIISPSLGSLVVLRLLADFLGRGEPFLAQKDVKSRFVIPGYSVLDFGVYYTFCCTNIP